METPFMKRVEAARAQAEMLKAIANDRRLLVLRLLIANGEMNVGDIAEHVKLSQSALSQHLAKLRAARVVKTRRDAQTIYYSIANGPHREIVEIMGDGT